MQRRTFLGWCAASGAAAAVQAQQRFPARPIKLVVGFGAGGSTDAVVRAVARQMEKVLGSPVVVENRAGAGGFVAAQYMRNAPPDGYTLFAGNTVNFGSTFQKNPIDVEREFVGLGDFSVSDVFLISGAASRIQTVEALREAARRGQLRYAAVAPQSEMTFAMIAKAGGFKFETIPYKTSDQVITGLVNNDVQLTSSSATGFLPLVQSGKLNFVATLSAKRSPVAPEVPTLQELGVPVAFSPTQGLWGPPGLTKDVAAVLVSALQAAANDREVQQTITGALATPSYLPPDRQLQTLRESLAFFADAARITGFQPS